MAKAGLADAGGGTWELGGNERTGGADARRALLVCKCKEMPRNPMPLGYRDPRGGCRAVPCPAAQ